MSTLRSVLLVAQQKLRVSGAWDPPLQWTVNVLYSHLPPSDGV